MMFKLGFKVLILFLLNFSAVIAQDTINLLNGKQIPVKNIYNEENKTYIKFDILKKQKFKLKTIDRLNVYSVSYSNKPELIIYARDSSLGYNLSLDEMKMFVSGERMAIKYYKAPWVTVVGLGAGFVPTIYMLNFYGLFAPVVYTVAMGIITPKAKVPSGYDQMLLADKNFIDGYKTSATKKKVKNAIIGSIAGVATAAVAAWTLVYLNK